MTTIREVPAIDAAADNTTDYTLPYFIDRFEGVLHDRDDEDRLAIHLTAGEAVTLTLSGHGDNPTPDTILTLYDADGNRLARNDDIDTGAGNLHSQLTFTPESDGTYYVSVAAYTGNPSLDNAGGYALTITPRAGEGGIDSYRDAEAGVTATLLDADGDRALEGSPHADVLTGNAGANLVFGGGGNDTLRGGAGDDRLYPSMGFTRLDGGPGSDWLAGHAGDDYARGYEWAVYDASSAGVTVSLAAGTGSGGDAEGDILHGIDGLIGSPHADTLTGNTRGNELVGGAGDDTLDGGGLSPGHWDYLEGGPGADTLIGDPAPAAGSVTLASYRASPAAVTVRLHDGTAEGGDAEDDTFEAINGLIGSTHDDILAGDDRTNLLSGAAGADALDGRGGDDVLHGDDQAGQRGGNDTLNGGAGDDWLDGGPGADALSGGEGQDTAAWLNSNAAVVVRLHSAAAQGGHAEGDTFATLVTIEYEDADGNPQREQVPDIEHLHGSAHNDTLAGDSRDNVLLGRGGHDNLYGGPGGGDDTLYGEAGNDKLYGGRGNDTLYGNAGNDTLVGGPGDDILFGGAGADDFAFAAGHGDDELADFGRGDRIDLSKFDELDSFDDLALSQDGPHTVIDLADHGGGTITLQYLDVGGLTGDDFIFAA